MKIVGIGETVLDIIFKNDNPQAAVPGGSTFNALISLGRTVPKKYPEIPIMMVTEVGDDHVGDIVVNFMEANGVCTDAVTRNQGSQSHVSLAFLDSNNDAHYQFYKDHAHAGLSAEKVGTVSFEKGDLVLFGSYFAINPVIRDFTKGLLTAARAAGATIYYDINFRASHLKDLPEAMVFIEENCRLADYVRGSSEDFTYLFGSSDGEDIYENHMKALCPRLILTRGGDPVEIYLPEKRMTFPVKAVKTVSTIGAGDNFNAGFIYSLLSGSDDWARRIAVATKFSAAVCQSVFNYVDKDFEAE